LLELQQRNFTWVSLVSILGRVTLPLLTTLFLATWKI
jgi:hypothetical protein